MYPCTRVDSGLYVGSFGFRYPADVHAVVCLSGESWDDNQTGLSAYTRFVVPEDPGNVWLHMVIRVVAAYRQAGWGVLVTCKDGNGDSGLIACAVVMWERGLSRDAALEFVRKSRPSIELNEAHLLALCAWDMFLRRAEEKGLL